MMNLVQVKMESILGPLYLVACAEALHGILWQERKGVPFVPEDLADSALAQYSPILPQAVREIQEYLARTRTQFTVPLKMEGTPFQRKVWQALTEIPYGKTMSYQELAQKLGSQAVRAVGTANSRNPISLIIPCHRVIRKDGTLGGYAGGLPNKTRLLAVEGAIEEMQKGLRR